MPPRPAPRRPATEAWRRPGPGRSSADAGKTAGPAPRPRPPGLRLDFAPDVFAQQREVFAQVQARRQFGHRRLPVAEGGGFRRRQQPGRQTLLAARVRAVQSSSNSEPGPKHVQVNRVGMLRVQKARSGRPLSLPSGLPAAPSLARRRPIRRLARASRAATRSCRNIKAAKTTSEQKQGPGRKPVPPEREPGGESRREDDIQPPVGQAAV